MPLTLPEISERLEDVEETLLLELLELKSKDIVARCQDLIEERADELEEHLE